jgi:ketosteroid isomerase-like protein
MKALKFLLLVPAIILYASCSRNAPGTVDTDLLTTAEVKDFISAYDGAWKGYDTTAMKELMDEKYIYFTSTGSTSDRKRILSWFTPVGKYKVDTAYRNEISIVLNGNTAIVSSHWKGNGSFDGTAFSDDQRCGLVVQKLSGKLKIISEHCIQITK